VACSGRHYDIGSTLYAAQVGRTVAGVISNSLPFSDQWLLDGLVAELLVPGMDPTDLPTAQTTRQCLVLACKRAASHVSSSSMRLETGSSSTDSQVSLLSRTFLDWDGEPSKDHARDNSGKNYHAVRSESRSDKRCGLPRTGWHADARLRRRSSGSSAAAVRPQCSDATLPR